MSNYYTNEPDILELVALIKAHNIKRAIVSPGSTNISFAASLMYDPDIEVYSAVDERSAAYMACGLAASTGEPVIISCTGATAARNYVPGLTEAFYRHLPILAVTSSQPFGRVGHYIPQVTDRTNPMNDLVKKSIQIPISHTKEDRWSNNVKINDALLELRRNGGGPVHINIETSFSKVFDVKELPVPRIIRRYGYTDSMPNLAAERIVIFVGAHIVFTEALTNEIENFCSRYNAIVLCDHTSNYKGKYRVLGGLVERQLGCSPTCKNADLLIHIGEMSGSYFSINQSKIWRVSPDGEVRDPFQKLNSVFEMEELFFFKHYNDLVADAPENNSYYAEWIETEKGLLAKLPELPFSSPWIAQQTASKLPQNSEIHFGILNSLRMWNLFELPNTVSGYSNVGGFGIDGCISSLIGSALANPNKLCFIVLGDLATFYDLNSLGNRHIGNNVRILVVNNGTGFEMRHKYNRGEVFHEDADLFFAAGGHFGNQSREFLKNVAIDLGFEYLCAESKEDYIKALPRFVSNEAQGKPILFEVFVKVEDENNAFNQIHFVSQDIKSYAKQNVKNIIGEKGVQTIKNLFDGL